MPPALPVGGVLYKDIMIGQFGPQRVGTRPVPGCACRGTLREQPLHLGGQGGLLVLRHSEHAVQVAQRLGGTRGIRARERPVRHPPVQLAHQVEDGAEGGRDVQVVVQSLLERSACARQECRQAGIVGTILAIRVKRGEDRGKPLHRGAAAGKGSDEKSNDAR